MAKIAVVGSYGVGLTVELERMPEAGETVIGRRFRMDAGGKGSNQAIGAARLGADVDLLTALGDDAFGHEAIALWQQEGVHAEVVLTEAATMAAPILVEPNGQNRIVVVPGALAELAPAHVDAFSDRIAAADVLVVQLEIPVWTALYALQVGRAAGVRTILNPAPAPVEPIAPDCDYVTPNETELAGVADARATMVVTLGDQGAELHGERIPAFPAGVVDTTGAGDAFAAGFVADYVVGRDARKAAAAGAKAATAVISRMGPR